MSAVTNVPRDIQESIRESLGRRVKLYIKRMVKQEVRPEKWENRVLTFSGCRIHIFTARAPSRQECSLKYLDIQSIESKKPNQLSLVVEGKPFNFVTLEAETDEVNHMITHIGVSIKQLFPAFPLERIIKTIEVHPAERLKPMQDMIKNVESKEHGPCGGFTMMYACMCDYHNVPYREEVAWDVDTIYLSQDSRELRLQDFDHLNPKDLVPIIAALEHNPWFTRLNVDNVKLSAEAQNEVLKVMMRNAVIEELSLCNTGITGDFVQKLATAILSNTGTQLTKVDLSNNLLEDKAIIHFVGSLGNLTKGLVHFDISRTKLTSRAINKVAETFSQNHVVTNTLKVFKIADNSTRGEELPQLNQFLAQPNAITHLDLSGTDCALEHLCGALLRGCCPSLTHLYLARNVFTYKKTKEVVVQPSWKNFFATVCGLELLDLSGCKIPPEALKELLLGIGSNMHIKNLHLDLSSNDLQSQGAVHLESCIANISNVTSLDISNNGLDQGLISMLDWIQKNNTLKHLAIGRNFDHVKPKLMPNVLESVVKLMQDEDLSLESLSLADSKLKKDVSVVINALGSNTTLTQLDISGNQMGDFGARMLSKALQINSKLRSIMWDKNLTTAQGFEDIADALVKNYTLRKMPTPVNDAAQALLKQPERTETALQKIEVLLQRNHSPQKYSSDQAYRLQQGFLISSTQQMVDRLVVQVQDTTNALTIGPTDEFQADIDQANLVVKDADNSKQLLPRLQDIGIKSVSEGNAVEQRLHQITKDLMEVLQTQVKNTVSEMVKCTEEHCTSVMSDKSLVSDLESSCAEKSALPKDFTKNVLDGVETEILNKLSELNLAVAAHISDRVIDAVLDNLSTSHKTLTNHLNVKKSKQKMEVSQPEPKPPEIIEEIDTEKKKTTDTEENEKPKNKDVALLQVDPSPVSTPNVRDQRKSRKIRPPTVIVGSQEDLTVLSENTESSLPATPAEPITVPKAEPMPVSKSERKPAPEALEIDSLPDLQVTKLNHIGKDRPKRLKTNRPRRPITKQNDVIANGDSLVADEGMDLFYNTPVVLKTVDNSASKDITPPKKEAPAEKTSKQELEKPPTESKPKKWSPFTAKDKDNKEKEKDKDKKGGGLANFFSRGKKKDEEKKSANESVKSGQSPERASKNRKSPERRTKTGKSPDRDLKDKSPERVNKQPEVTTSENTPNSVKREESVKSEKSADEETEMTKEPPKEEKNETLPETEVKKPGPPKIALMPKKPIFGGNLLAEMKVKQENRASKMILDEKTKTPDNEQKNTKEKTDVKEDKKEDEKKEDKNSENVNDTPLRPPRPKSSLPKQDDTDAAKPSILKMVQPKPKPAPRASGTSQRTLSQSSSESVKESQPSRTSIGDSKPKPQPPVKPRPPATAPKPGRSSFNKPSDIDDIEDRTSRPQSMFVGRSSADIAPVESSLPKTKSDVNLATIKSDEQESSENLDKIADDKKSKDDNKDSTETNDAEKGEDSSKDNTGNTENSGIDVNVEEVIMV